MKLDDGHRMRMHNGAFAYVVDLRAAVDWPTPEPLQPLRQQCETEAWQAAALALDVFPEWCDRLAAHRLVRKAKA